MNKMTLILAFMISLFLSANAFAELSYIEFLRKYVHYFKNRDTQKIVELVSENYDIAQHTKSMLDFDAQKNREFAPQQKRLSNFLSKIINELEEKTPEKLLCKCDRLATDPQDEAKNGKVRGVSDKNMDSLEAVIACEEISDRFPNVSRFQYQFGRASIIYSRNNIKDLGIESASDCLNKLAANVLSPQDIAIYKESIEQYDKGVDSLINAGNMGHERASILLRKLGIHYAGLEVRYSYTYLYGK